MNHFMAITALLVMMTGRAVAQTADVPTISVDDVTMEKGETKTVDINYSLTGDVQYVGFNFRVVLPEGLALVEDPENEGYPWYDDTLPAIAMLNITTTAGGSFAATPRSANAVIRGSEGVLMRIMIKAEETLAPGTQLTARLTNVSLNHRDASYNVSKTKLPDVEFDVTIAGQVNGDLNDDGKVDVSDIMNIVSYLSAPSTHPEGGAGYDLNGDGKVDVADIIAILNMMAK